MKGVIGTFAAVALVGGVGAWATRHAARPMSGVRTDPCGVHEGEVLPSLKPRAGNSLIAFSSGCFWGSEQAFRKVPGIVATAVGYTGGTSTFPNEQVAHATGHLETVLVEFNPKRTPVVELLKVFWTLPRSKTSLASRTPKASYKATIWTYDTDEAQQAELSKRAMEKSMNTQLAVQVRSACTFYFAEDFHQQYDEKAGKELCRATP